MQPAITSLVEFGLATAGASTLRCARIQMNPTTPKPYHFALRSSGRCGTVTCTKGTADLKLDWEISGVSDKDILLAPMDLNRWTSGTNIPREEQLDILAHLRAWLDESGTRSDIARPAAPTDFSSHCMRADCSGHAMTGSAYCPTHYDATLLK